MENYRPINFLLVDDHQFIVEALVNILQNKEEIGEIYTANNGKDAVGKVLAYDIDCMIIDVSMPVLDGYEATRLIKKEKPAIKVIVVSMYCDVPMVSKMIKAGADAFINKDTGKDELLKAIDTVMNNQKYISPGISYNLFTHLSDRDVHTLENEKHLTARELEIVGYIANGLTNHQIADKLFLSIVTVDTHRKNMLAKLKLKNTALLVKYAADHKLL
jgi:DNA-binding NarL/FixJ family response regulator